MLGDFLWRVAENKLAQWCSSLCLSVCMLKHFGTWSTNGWAKLDGGVTIRRAGTLEWRWCQSRSCWWQVTRATANVPTFASKLQPRLQAKPVDGYD